MLSREIKNTIKGIAIAFAAIVALTVIDIVVRFIRLDSLQNSVLIYNEQEYERAEYWSVGHYDYTEAIAFYGKKDAKSKDPNTTVKVINGTNDEFILTKFNKVDVLYHKKDKKFPSYLNKDSVANIHIKLNGRLEKVSGQMAQKILNHLGAYENIILKTDEKLPFRVLTNVTITYKEYENISQSVGNFAIYQDNIVFMPSSTDPVYKAMGNYDFIPFPFNPLADFEEINEQISQVYSVDSQIDSNIVIYKDKIYRHTTTLVPTSSEGEFVDAYYGKENFDDKTDNKIVFLFNNCDEEFIRVKVDKVEKIYYSQDAAIPSTQDQSKIEKIILVSDDGEKTLEKDLYNDLLSHIKESKDKCYLSTVDLDNRKIGDLMVYFDDSNAAIKLGEVVYDTQYTEESEKVRTICFYDTSIRKFEDFRWVYPLPENISNIIK